MTSPIGAGYWIERLGLVEHPEGGWYRETYRSAPGRGPRPASGAVKAGRASSTLIYYLLAGDSGGSFSAFHRLPNDEIWHFYAGGAVLLHLLDPAGGLRALRLGSGPAGAEAFHAVVPAGVWFAAVLEEPGPEAWALVGCSMAPGFEPGDLELADRDTLARDHPRHRDLIARLTR